MTRPSRSIARKVWVSTFAVIARSGARSSVNLRRPPSRQSTTIAVHLSPIWTGSALDGQTGSNISGSSGSAMSRNAIPVSLK
ncbi:hypothetical protein [Catellatospora vulcania]|uniref:hypothetical protein n=1 Tax=Catellatospora vulcania TaxID=1460450 RepID=UPI001E4C0185|nr:hypothetical protein [Catellatospora vulcania]